MCLGDGRKKMPTSSKIGARPAGGSDAGVVDQATRPHKMPKRLPPPPRDHAEPAAPSGSVRGLPPALSGFENGLSLAAPAPGIRDIGTYCVPGEKPDNHPERCCADRETYLWTCHHARLVGASDSSLPDWVAAEIAAAELPQHQPPGSGLIINVGAFHETMRRPRAASPARIALL
jgi:hypothetical protein